MGSPSHFIFPELQGCCISTQNPGWECLGALQYCQSPGLRAAPSELDESGRVEVGVRPLSWRPDPMSRSGKAQKPRGGGLPYITLKGLSLQGPPTPSRLKVSLLFQCEELGYHYFTQCRCSPVGTGILNICVHRKVTKLTEVSRLLVQGRDCSQALPAAESTLSP